LECLFNGKDNDLFLIYLKNPVIPWDRMRLQEYQINKKTGRCKTSLVSSSPISGRIRENRSKPVRMNGFLQMRRATAGPAQQPDIPKNFLRVKTREF